MAESSWASPGDTRLEKINRSKEESSQPGQRGPFMQTASRGR